MQTTSKQDSTNRKMVGFRVSPDLWSRVTDARQRLGQSTQFFCTLALERHLSFVSSSTGIDAGEPSVRRALPVIRKS